MSGRRSNTTYPVDKASLEAFLNESGLVGELDARIGSLVRAAVLPPDPETVRRYLEYLNFVGIASIGALNEALRKHQGEIEQFARLWLEGSRYEWVGRGISIFYLTYVLLAHQRDPKPIRDWLDKFEIGATEERDQLVGRVLATAGKAGVIDAVP